MVAYPLEMLFPNELERRLEACPLLVLPIGTIEWHSHHLPLGFDGIVAGDIGAGIAARCDAVLAPVSYWAAGGVAYPYTLKLSVDVIEPLLTAALTQFAEMGFRVITVYTGHFGIEQTLALKRAALTVMLSSPVSVLPLTAYDLVTDFYKGDHAAAGETAMMQALHPDGVRLDAVAAEAALDGVLGSDPRQTSIDGRHLVDTIMERSAAVSMRLLRQTTAIQRARYVEGLQIAVRVLAMTFEQRQKMPKSLVPSVTTPAYVAYCQAVFAGDYDSARNHIERKWGDLSA